MNAPPSPTASAVLSIAVPFAAPSVTAPTPTARGTVLSPRLCLRPAGRSLLRVVAQTSAPTILRV